MIERLARAMAAADGKDPDQPAWWSPRQGGFGICWRDQYADKARSVLAALREPSEGMVIAGCHHENMGDMAGRWRAMIRAAEGEG